MQSVTRISFSLWFATADPASRGDLEADGVKEALEVVDDALIEAVRRTVSPYQRPIKEYFSPIALDCQSDAPIAAPGRHERGRADARQESRGSFLAPQKSEAAPRKFFPLPEPAHGLTG
jgi:hypothetical protein